MTGRRTLIAVAVAIGLGACSASAKPSSPTTGAAQTSAVPVTTGAATTAPIPPSSSGPASTDAATTTSSTAPPQTVTITPDTGLTDQQVVHIVAKGFVAGTTYAAVECADKGTATTPGDCDLAVVKVAAADAAGTVTIDFPAQKGPFGDNKITCSGTQKCLISVENAGASNTTVVATRNISFAT